MPRTRDVICAGGCGKWLFGGRGALPEGQRTCTECRGHTTNAGRLCLEVECEKPARKRGFCSTHYNKSTGHYIGAVAKDPERERARLRLKTHRRKDWARLTDVTPEYELELRRKASKCPLCSVRMTDEPYLSYSKETDHIVPRNAGGTHTMGNLRVICRTCNLARPRDGSDYFGPITLWAGVA